MTDDNDDWKFNVDKDELEKKVESEKKSKTSVLKKVRERKERQDSSLELNYDEMPKRRSRSEYAKTPELDASRVMLQIASIADRVAAFLIDLVVVVLFSFLSRYIAHTEVTFTIVNFIFYYLYFCTAVGKTGMTLGKFVLKIKIVTSKGKSLSMSEATMREFIGRTLSFLSIIGLLLALFDKQRRTLHDRMFKTLVVKKIN